MDQPVAKREGSSNPPRLTIVIVNHESWADAAALVTALCDSTALADGRCEIIVVDNASRGTPPEAIVEELGRGCRLILRPENGGFAAGVNEGFRLARGEWILALNPDIIPPPCFPERVLSRIDEIRSRPAAERPAILGFALQNPDGSRQPSVGVFPRITRCVREQFIPRSRRKYQPVSRVRPGPVDWVTGACMLIQADFMLELQGMDQDFFLYHEEVALCLQARRLGRRVEYDPTITAVHAHPLQNRVVSPKMHVILRHSKLLYFRKYLPKWEFDLLAWGVRLEALARWAAAALIGDHKAQRAWRAVLGITRDLAKSPPGGPRGIEVLRLAELCVSENASSAYAVPAPHAAPARDRAAAPRPAGSAR